jgi:hypothetical protein
VATTTVVVPICVFRTEEGTSVCVQLALSFMPTGMFRTTFAVQKLCNEDFHNMSSSPSLHRTIKLRMRWAGHVT